MTVHRPRKRKSYGQILSVKKTTTPTATCYLSIFRTNFKLFLMQTFNFKMWKQTDTNMNEINKVKLNAPAKKKKRIGHINSSKKLYRYF